MGSRGIFFCVLLSLFCLSFAADQVKVTVKGVTSIARTEDNFICATLDWWPSNKCDYNQCPWGRAGIPYLDLDNKILANAIKEVCTYMLIHLCRALVTFGVNALFGRRRPISGDSLWSGDWNPQNARDLMEYTVSKGYKIDSYEFGNELCGTGVSARIQAEQYGKDVVALKNLVGELYPDPDTRPQVLGPAGFYDEKWFNRFLQATGPNVVDGLTHHIYNLGAGVDSTLINKVQDPFFLDQIAQTYKDISRSIQLFGPWSGAWVGEAGGAYNSGGKDVSRTFVDGFWYLDQLGMTSTFNHKVFCRQAFIGGNYAILNTTTFMPNPDYYGALLFHRLMGKNVLSVNHNGSPYLRAYSHCSKNSDGIAVLLINMSNSTTFEISVVNDFNFYPEDRFKTMDDSDGTKQREEYHLTPKDGNIQSDVVLLNGTPLKLTESSDIPSMNPKLVDASLPITVVPDSIVFATLKGFQAPACA
ncbi:unnamed protein product [Fraxinus pennsylvanica]|uniref:Heparanase-like protein 1 n=1 Tax=Fraxinus pennsylvanica TaxID=56036 RepID=A0AAD2EEW8_9LAMI|nr:unnamed protein product [Fraxinus pennsylvanica]